MKVVIRLESVRMRDVGRCILTELQELSVCWLVGLDGLVPGLERPGPWVFSRIHQVRKCMYPSQGSWAQFLGGGV